MSYVVESKLFRADHNFWNGRTFFILARDINEALEIAQKQLEIDQHGEKVHVINSEGDLIKRQEKEVEVVQLSKVECTILSKMIIV